MGHRQHFAPNRRGRPSYVLIPLLDFMAEAKGDSNYADHK